MEIPFSKSTVDDKEYNAVKAVLKSGWLTQGKKVKEFEEQFADYVGAKYAVAVNSCTAALFLCLKYHSAQMRGKKVIVPGLTFTASASTIVHAGLEPYFCEINQDDFCLHSMFAHLLIQSKKEDLNFDTDIGGVVAVHLTGNKCPTRFDNLVVIEDSAHRILRNTQGDNPVCYSFYATKNMTTGEGGMITTNDEEFYKWARVARLHGCNKNGFERYKDKNTSSWKYSVDFCGWKCNMTDIMAAIGIEQLKKLDWMNERRQYLIDRYNDRLGLNRKGLHLYPIRVKNRDDVIEKLLKAGIHCSVHFLPLNKMPAYKKFETTLSITEEVSSQLISLPLYPTMEDKEVDYVCDKVLSTKSLIKR